MPLIFQKTKRKESGFRKWSQKNSQRLSEKRKKRYAEDPAYRQKRLEAAKKRRETGPLNSMPDGYVFFKQAAEEVGVTVSTLRHWREQEHFPEPKHQNGHLLFTEHQVLLLKSLEKFFRIHGKKTWKSARHKLKELVASIHANWG